MSSEGPPEPFAAEAIQAVADEFDVDAERLRAVLEEHQELMARLPGVENLVYEWRKQFGATVIERAAGWYVVAAPNWAWEEFGDDLEATEAEVDALIALHERTRAEQSGTPTAETEEFTPMVLLRD